MIEALSQLHFMRPHWLWALLALPVLTAWWHWQRRRASVWREHVDPHLLPHLVEPGLSRSGLGGLAVRLLACALAVLALAGPSWRQGEVALQQDGRALVVALDLSDATLTPDLPPSRLLQARAWLGALLAEHEGEVGLVAFSDDAYTVAPVTGDAANVAIFLDALAPEVMPVDGHRPERAIHAAMTLLAQAGHSRGDILLITYGADEATATAAARAQAAGLRVSVLGLGRPAGASYRARDGSLRPSRLDVASLQRVAAAGGGEYASLAEGADVLPALSPAGLASGGDGSRTLAGSRVWRDDGYWLLLPLMLLVLLAFRRGVALLALGACLLLPPQLHAAEPIEGTPWRRADQVEHRRMREGLDAYRAGRHDEAERIWHDLPGADAAYNRGNALARAGRLEDAIKAYDEALRRQPGMEDAIANRAVVEAALRRQPPQGPGAPRQQPDAGDEQAGDTRGAGEQAPPEQADGSPGEQGSTSPRPPPDAGTPGAEQTPSPEPQATQGDGEGQQQADAAQRERIQQALENAARAGDGEEETPQSPEGEPPPAETAAERERRAAAEAWLRRVPDDPGGLLRERFRLEHERRSGRSRTP